MTRLIKLHTPARLRRLVGGLVANRRLPYFEFNTFPSLVDDKSGKTSLSYPRPMLSSRRSRCIPHENKLVKKRGAMLGYSRPSRNRDLSRFYFSLINTTLCYENEKCPLVKTKVLSKIFTLKTANCSHNCDTISTEKICKVIVWM